MMNSHRRIKTIRISFILSLLFMPIAICLFRILVNGADSKYSQAIGILGLCIIIICVLTNRLSSGKFFLLITLFELSYYILTSGQSFLYALNIPTESTLDLYRTNTATQVNRAYIYNYFCLIALHLGIRMRFSRRITFSLGKPTSNLNNHYRISTDYTGTMKLLGWFLLIISFVPYMYNNYRLFLSYRLAGYAAAYSSIAGNTSWSKIPDLIASYFVFSVFLLLVSYRHKKHIRIVLVLVVFIIALLNFAVGNRSEPICYLFALFWFLQKYSESNTEKGLTRLMIASLILGLFLVIPIIGATRNNGTLSFSTITDAIVGKDSAFVLIRDTFVGMGWSAFPLIKTMELIPKEYNYHYGQSYFFALLSVFPNVFGGTHISVKYAGLPAWLMRVLHMTYGPGYSMPAEAFYNFGWLGIAIMIPFGVLLRKLLSEDFDNSNSLKLFNKLALFIVLFSIPRREMLTAVHNTAYYVGLIDISVIILQKYFFRNRSYKQSTQLNVGFVNIEEQNESN